MLWHPDEGEIHEWLDGSLSADRALQLEEHVRECDRCAEAVAEARGFVAAASRLVGALDGVPGGVTPTVKSTTGVTAPRKRLWGLGSAVVVRIAAAAVLIVGATVYLTAGRGGSESGTAAGSGATDAASIVAEVTVAPSEHKSERGAVAIASGDSVGVQSDFAGRGVASGAVAGVVGAVAQSQSGDATGGSAVGERAAVVVSGQGAATAQTSAVPTGVAAGAVGAIDGERARVGVGERAAFSVGGGLAASLAISADSLARLESFIAGCYEMSSEGVSQGALEERVVALLNGVVRLDSVRVALGADRGGAVPDSAGGAVAGGGAGRGRRGGGAGGGGGAARGGSVAGGRGGVRGDSSTAGRAAAPPTSVSAREALSAEPVRVAVTVRDWQLTAADSVQAHIDYGGMPLRLRLILHPNGGVAGEAELQDSTGYRAVARIQGNRTRC